MTQDDPATRFPSMALWGMGAPIQVRVHSMSLSGAVVQLPKPATVTAGRWLTGNLRHPDHAPTQAPMRVVWCRTLPWDPNPYLGLEFLSTWDQLRALRRTLATCLGSWVMSGDDLLGYILPDSTAPFWTCYGPATTALAQLRREERHLVIRQAGGKEMRAGTLNEGLAFIFHSTAQLRVQPPVDIGQLDPPAQSATSEQDLLAAKTLILPGSSSALLSPEVLAAAHRAVFDDDEPATPARTEPEPIDEEAILGMQTVVLDTKKAERADPVVEDRRLVLGTNTKKPPEPFNEEEDAILDAKTVVIDTKPRKAGSKSPSKPRQPDFLADLKLQLARKDPVAQHNRPDSTELETVAVGRQEVRDHTDAETVKINAAELAPLRDPKRRKSKPHRVLAGVETVGYIAPSKAGEGSWSLYSPAMEKIAVVVGVGDQYHVAYMGTDASDSMEFLQAESSLAALAMAFELPDMPRVDPPLEGFGS